MDKERALADAVRAVMAAMEAAVTKHGSLTVDPVRACAILGREWGEAMNEALTLTVPAPGSVRNPVHMRRRLYAELAQVAATAILAMANVDMEASRRKRGDIR